MFGDDYLKMIVYVFEIRALRAAEKIRQLVAAETFRLPQDATLQLTASLGLAVFNGHPDYQQLLRRADAALYQAKHSGRSRAVLASAAE